MFNGVLNESTMGEYDWFKYLISELSTGSYGFKEGGRDYRYTAMNSAPGCRAYTILN